MEASSYMVGPRAPVFHRTDPDLSTSSFESMSPVSSQCGWVRFASTRWFLGDPRNPDEKENSSTPGNSELGQDRHDPKPSAAWSMPGIRASPKLPGLVVRSTAKAAISEHACGMPD